jgi:hypothetical protein
MRRVLSNRSAESEGSTKLRPLTVKACFIEPMLLLRTDTLPDDLFGFPDISYVNPATPTSGHKTG